MYQLNPSAQFLESKLFWVQQDRLLNKYPPTRSCIILCFMHCRKSINIFNMFQAMWTFKCWLSISMQLKWLAVTLNCFLFWLFPNELYAMESQSSCKFSTAGRASLGRKLLYSKSYVSRWIMWKTICPFIQQLYYTIAL